MWLSMIGGVARQGLLHHFQTILDVSQTYLINNYQGHLGTLHWVRSDIQFLLVLVRGKNRHMAISREPSVVS